MRRLKPDLLLLAANANDFRDSMNRPLFLLDGDRLVRREPMLDKLYRSFPLQQSLPRWLAPSRIAARITRRVASLTAAPTPDFEDSDAEIRWVARKTGLSIRDLAAIARADGTDFALVVLPADSKADDP